MEKKAHNKYFRPKDILIIILLMFKVFNGGSKILFRLWITDETQVLDKVLEIKQVFST